jgi:hypothetical protein
MVPLRNGVVLYSQEHNGYFKADAYRLPGFGWLFRVNNQVFHESLQEDFKVHKIHGWFDSNSNYTTHGTMLVPAEGCMVNPDFIAEYLVGDEYYDREEFYTKTR